MQATSNKTFEFITQQNTRLKEQIEELKDMIRVNKESIDILTQSKHPSHNHNATLNFQDNKIKAPRNQALELKDIIKKLNSKNSSIMDELFKLQRENDDLRSKLLLLEQITEGYEDQQKINIQMMESQLKSLSRNLVSTNEKLNETEKHRFKVDNISGLAVKFKEIYNPTQQAMKFESMDFKLRQELAIRQMQIDKLKQDNRNLEKLNMSLQHQLIKMKTALLMPNKPLDRIGQASIKKLALFFLQAQRKVLQGEQSDQQYQDIEIMAPQLATLFPDKIEAYRKKKQSKVTIPKLDFGRIRQLMNYNKKFVEAQLKKRNNIPRTQRIKLLEDQIDFTRRELTRALLDVKGQQINISNLQRMFKELQNRHKLIENSYESMCRKMTNKNKNQLKPDMNQTMNPYMIYKNSPVSQKPLTQTKDTNSPHGFTSKQSFRIQIYQLSQQVANLPFYNNHQQQSHNPSKSKASKSKIKRSSSHHDLTNIIEPQRIHNQYIITQQTQQQIHEIDRYQQNLDNIEV